VRQIEKRIITAASLLILFASATATAFGQVDSVVGKYVGTAKSAGSPDAEITLELIKAGDKITGFAKHGDAKLDVTEGTFSEDKLTLKFGPGGKEGTLIAKLDGAKLTGEWASGSQKKTVELKRVGESTGAVLTTAPLSTDTVNLNGQWDGVADAQGQPFPFLLTLKIDGEKVTGSSSSQLGEAQISSGTWKDGKLNFQLEGGSGVIVMSAVVLDGKLSGDFDYAGQAQGKWVAVRKN
jgi:hypothetical protein